MNTTELNLNEMAKINGGWDWDNFTYGAVEGAVYGVCAGGMIGLHTGGGVGFLIGASAGAVIGAGIEGTIMGLKD